ncbi:MAG: HAMP domain-containing histidine kinase [Sphingomonadales bacterium]|nr:HAMP domain-containing histidine kinase [Sphingomonadales bacterium]MDE2170581.1 HAMP domain-containing histidine kinase [Sphingomonadales bacterium]
MKGRLFWKIFTAFCCVFFGQLGVLWTLFIVIERNHPYWADDLERYAAPRLEQMAAAIIAHQGPGAIPVTLTGGTNPTLVVTAEGAAPPSGTRATTALATAPDGHRWRIFYRLPRKFDKGGITPPLIFYISGILSGLVFAAILGLYLSLPIRALREGLERFARGDLGVRLAARMGRRRDEIADLARDFDGMAEKVEQLVLSRSQLIDDMSHELRSPLARLQLAIALARQKPDGAMIALDRIEQEARRLDTMAGSLLTLSRLESAGARPDHFVHLRALIEDLLADIRFESEAKNLQIVLTCHASMPEGFHADVAGDAELLRRAFENVLRNALRFSPRDGTIHVTLSEETDRIVVEIEDEGPGVPAEQLSRLFEPFHRGEGETGGFGLGLAIARRAVVVHEGTIVLTNRRPSGLHVCITLPARWEEAAL